MHIMTTTPMQWSTLFSTQRSGDTRSTVTDTNALRTAYVRDYDRIIFSSAFRRLQNKTQVFPLPGPVFVHNRLTHSLEVASVGRSLGRLVGHVISERYPQQQTVFHDFYKHELGTVIAAACLAHDIGNPPFGHSGEDAIRAYFTHLPAPIADYVKDKLTDNQLKDFQYFEGNSNAFRILTHPYVEQASGGFNITITTLAAIVKYPTTSSEGFNKKSGLISCKKSGFFDSERNTFQALANALQIPKVAGKEQVYARHPFVFLTEAADDVCYRIIDLEDAHRIGITSIETIKELFLPFFEAKNTAQYYTRAKIEEKMAQIVEPNQQVAYLRAVWIGFMIEQLSQIFIQEETALLNGSLQKSLMDLMPEPYQSLIQKVNRYSYEKVYQHKPVVEIELTGYQVIGHLLATFITALVHPERTQSEKVLALLSPQFPIHLGNEDKLYHNIQSVVDYIAGMTDLYAMDLYRKMTGIIIPSL
jgi:dGTPase